MLIKILIKSITFYWYEPNLSEAAAIFTKILRRDKFHQKYLPTKKAQDIVVKSKCDTIGH